MTYIFDIFPVLSPIFLLSAFFNELTILSYYIYLISKTDVCNKHTIMHCVYSVYICEIYLSI